MLKVSWRSKKLYSEELPGGDVTENQTRTGGRYCNIILPRGLYERTNTQCPAYTDVGHDVLLNVPNGQTWRRTCLHLKQRTTASCHYYENSRQNTYYHNQVTFKYSLLKTYGMQLPVHKTASWNETTISTKLWSTDHIFFLSVPKNTSEVNNFC